MDAAVAAVAAQGVVAPETCGIGGDLFALVNAPGWETPRALNASGRAGTGVSAESLRADGMDRIPADHPAVVTIPGCVDGMAELVDSLGRLDLKTVLHPAIELAEGGFEVSVEQAVMFAERTAEYASNPAISSFYPDGHPVRHGHTVMRTDLARTLRDIGDGGRSSFYAGIPGEDVVAAVGGSISLEDLAESQASWVDPISIEVDGITSWTVPPNSQGYLGPATAAVFKMLEPPEDAEDPLWWHLLIEAYRGLAWERNELVADPDTHALPPQLLLDAARLERVAGSVDPDHAGTWPDRMGAVKGTAYMCVADDEGMAVSIIQSNYRGTGSVFGAARSGFLLQDRGLGFNLIAGHPNELAPGKRPLHTLSPTLWSDATGTRWLLGTRGGAVQPQLIAQMAARVILGGANPDQAQAAPRWTVRDFGPGSPPRPSVEPGATTRVMEGLAKRGHELIVVEGPQRGWGPVSMIEVDEGRRRASADPRVETASAVVF